MSSHNTNGINDAPPSQLSELLFVSSTILQQALDLVDNVLTDNNQLTVQSQYLPGSTIGNPFPRLSYSLFDVDGVSNRKTLTPCTGSFHSSD